MFNSGSLRGQKSDNNSSNTDDNFIRFHQSPPAGNTFTPQHFSSPLGNRRGNNNWRGRNHYNHSHNESGNSPNFNYNRGNVPYHRRNKNSLNKSNSRDDIDISYYYSHEMVEDPWLKLEEKQRNDEVRDAKFDEDKQSTTSESNSNNSDNSSSEDES